jgi:hypothetical protein
MSTNSILATTPLVSTNYLLRATGTTIGNSLIFDNGTNVGIGNTNTTYTLDVSGTGRFTGNVTVGSTSTSVGGLLVIGGSSIGTANANNGQIYLGATSAYRGVISYDEGPGYLYIDNTYNNASSNIYFRTKTSGTAITAMTILGSGNVGIGTSSPLNVLDVRAASATMGNYQTIQAFSTDSAAINLGGGISLGGYFTATTSIAQFGSIVGRKENGTSGNYDGYLAFGTNAQATGVVERMRIQSNGNVLMGKTAEDNAADGFQYRGAVPGLVQITRAGGEALQLWRYTSNGKMLVFYYAGSEVGSISSNSNSLPSDLNFKKDISNITLGLNLVTKLRPVHYRHKLDDDNEALSNGIIAQELEEALLECGIENNSLLMLQHKPNEKENESQYWVDYTKMIPILIKSIQEQQALITSLQEQINELKNK